MKTRSKRLPPVNAVQLHPNRIRPTQSGSAAFSDPSILFMDFCHLHQDPSLERVSDHLSFPGASPFPHLLSPRTSPLYPRLSQRSEGGNLARLKSRHRLRLFNAPMTGSVFIFLSLLPISSSGFCRLGVFIRRIRPGRHCQCHSLYQTS